MLCGEFAPRDGPDAARADRRDRRAGALLERSFEQSSRTRRGTPGRFVSHLYRGAGRRGRRERACSSARGTADLRLVDNGAAAEGGHTYHLIPATASKAAAVELHMRARGFAPEECIAVGDSLEDLGVAPLVGRFFLVANGPSEARGPNVSAPSRASATASTRPSCNRSFSKGHPQRGATRPPLQPPNGGFRRN